MRVAIARAPAKLTAHPIEIYARLVQTKPKNSHRESYIVKWIGKDAQGCSWWTNANAIPIAPTTTTRTITRPIVCRSRSHLNGISHLDLNLDLEAMRLASNNGTCNHESKNFNHFA